MSRLDLNPSDFDRILVVDDSADDITEILTVACESFRSRSAGQAEGEFQ